MKHRPWIILSLGVSLLAGCSHDGRLADLAQQVTHEQAAQNERMAEATSAIAEGSQQLVHADAQARRDLIELQQDLRHDQAHLTKQHDALESERRAIAQQRLTDSQVGGGLVALGAILAALAPLLLAGLSLIGLWREPTPAEEGQILIEALSRELLASQQSGGEHMAGSPGPMPDIGSDGEQALT